MNEAEIQRSIEVTSSPEEVWERIIDGALSEEWMGVKLTPRPGGAVVVPGEDLLGTVEGVVPQRSITWSWRKLDGEPSQVTIDIEPTESGSRVTVTERLLTYRITGSPPVMVAA